MARAIKETNIVSSCYQGLLRFSINLKRDIRGVQEKKMISRWCRACPLSALYKRPKITKVRVGDQRQRGKRPEQTEYVEHGRDQGTHAAAQKPGYAALAQRKSEPKGSAGRTCTAW